MTDRHIISQSAAAPLSARQRIVTGARQHFLAHGFRNVTMEDLARELGMSKKTLYAHFASKVELLQAVIRDKFHELNRTLEGITPRAQQDFQETLRGLMACLQHHAHEIQPAFIRDIRRETPEVFALVEQLRHDAIQLHFGRLFTAGRRRGLVRKDISTQILIEILLGATQAIVNPIKMSEFKLTPETAFHAVCSVILEGALAPRGRKSK